MEFSKWVQIVSMVGVLGGCGAADLEGLPGGSGGRRAAALGDSEDAVEIVLTGLGAFENLRATGVLVERPLATLDPHLRREGVISAGRVALAFPEGRARLESPAAQLLIFIDVDEDGTCTPGADQFYEWRNSGGTPTPSRLELDAASLSVLDGAVACAILDEPFDLEASGRGFLHCDEGQEVFALATSFTSNGARTIAAATRIHDGRFWLLLPDALPMNQPDYLIFVDRNGDRRCNAGDLWLGGTLYSMEDDASFDIVPSDLQEAGVDGCG